MDIDYTKNLRVLLVDDVQVHRFLMASGLSRVNPFIKTDQAGSLAQAVQMLGDNEYQAVISDSGSVATANGLSIYMPPAGTDLSTYTPSMYSFLGSSNWDSFLSNAASWSPIF